MSVPNLTVNFCEAKAKVQGQNGHTESLPILISLQSGNSTGIGLPEVIWQEYDFQQNLSWWLVVVCTVKCCLVLYFNSMLPMAKAWLNIGLLFSLFLSSPRFPSLFSPLLSVSLSSPPFRWKSSVGCNLQCGMSLPRWFGRSPVCKEIYVHSEANRFAYLIKYFYMYCRVPVNAKHLFVNWLSFVTCTVFGYFCTCQWVPVFLGNL